jgi:hypothetical protein
MSACTAGLARQDIASFNQNNFNASIYKLVSDGDTCNTCTNDTDICLEILSELRKPRAVSTDKLESAKAW